MSWLPGNQDAIRCPHCGASLRKGMLRCRECGGVADDDFQLSEQVRAEAYTPQCANCGSPLEGEDEDCAQCAAAMLDELLSSAPEEPSPQLGHKQAAQMDELQTPASASRLRPESFQSGAFKSESGRPAKSRGGKSQRTAGKPARSSGDDLPVQARSKGPKARRDVDEDVMDYLASPPEPKADRESPMPLAAETDTTPEASARSSTDAASQASAALIMSLASTDSNLRCQAATALGQLGVPDSISALEPLMADPEVRVRRAVAESLIQLGHPKGETLRSIAERKPAVAKEPPRPRVSKPGKSWSLPRFSFSFGDLDHETLVRSGGPIAGVVLVLGGIFLWHSGLLLGPRLDESYRPIKPFYAFWMADPASATPPAPPKTADANGPEMNF